MVLIASSTNADVITAWNYIALDAIRVDATPPPEAARDLAILGTSVYTAVNAIDRTYENYKVWTPPVWGNASEEAAAVTAAYSVLKYLFPEQSFLEQFKTSMAAIPRGPAKIEGMLLGSLVSHAILGWRYFDGSNASSSYMPTDPPVPGHWQPTPPDYDSFLLPQWGNVKPFAMTSSDQFRQPPPPALTSQEYTDSFNKTESLGAIDSVTRTADQTQIANFWKDGAGTVTPPGHFFQIALEVATAQGNTLTENARLFALLGMAEADAGICAWDMKKYYDFWRPSTAIQNADTDGNPNTVADKNWQPLLVDPSFPSYVSGHSTFGWAAAAVLGDFFGTDDISFSSTSDSLPGVTRYFDSFSDAAEENGMSRIYAGVHWDFDDLSGHMAGEALGNYVFANFLTPVQPNQLPSTLVNWCLFNITNPNIYLKDGNLTNTNSGVDGAQYLDILTGADVNYVTKAVNNIFSDLSDGLNTYYDPTQWYNYYLGGSANTFTSGLGHLISDDPIGLAVSQPQPGYPTTPTVSLTGRRASTSNGYYNVGLASNSYFYNLTYNFVGGLGNLRADDRTYSEPLPLNDYPYKGWQKYDF
jgi:membrane-associated phospholipid phosphatase